MGRNKDSDDFQTVGAESCLIKISLCGKLIELGFKKLNHEIINPYTNHRVVYKFFFLAEAYFPPHWKRF